MGERSTPAAIMIPPKSIVYRGITIRKARSGYAVLWPTQLTSFTPNINAAKNMIRKRLKQKRKL